MIRRFSASVIAMAILLFLSAPAQAAYTIVAVDSNGEVTFTPSGMVVPILIGVAAAIVSATGLIVLWKGARWLWKVIKGAN